MIRSENLSQNFHSAQEIKFFGCHGLPVSRRTCKKKNHASVDGLIGQLGGYLFDESSTGIWLTSQREKESREMGDSHSYHIISRVVWTTSTDIEPISFSVRVGIVVGRSLDSIRIGHHPHKRQKQSRSLDCSWLCAV